MPISSDQCARLDALCTSAPDSPGLAAGVVLGGEAVFARGSGLANLEHRAPITPASRFYLASVSKQVAATAVVLAAEAGALDLADPIRKTIPQLPRFMDGVTIRHLLAHTGGVRDYFTLGAFAGLKPGHPYTESDVLGLLVRQRALSFAPGADFSYSNSGYVLAAIALHRATGKRLDDFARETLFDPLGMAGARFQHDHTAVVPDKACGYAERNGRWHVADSTLDVVADGGLYASLNDMLAWAANLLAPRVAASAIARIQVPETLAGGAPTGYGLGLAIRRRGELTMLEHGGGLAGYRTHLLAWPSEGCAVVVLCNDAAAAPHSLARRIAQVVVGERLPPLPAIASPPPPAAIRARAAPYRNPDNGVVLPLTEKDGALSLLGMPLDPLGDDLFAVEGDPHALAIAFDPDGGAFTLTQGTSASERFHRCAPPQAFDDTPFLGDFHSPDVGPCRIARDADGALTVSFAGAPSSALRPIAPDRLWCRDLGLTLTLEADGLTVDGMRVRGLRYGR